MGTLADIEATYAAACEAVTSAVAAHAIIDAAVMACHEGGAPPPADLLSRWHVAGHRVTIAHHECSAVEYRLARYRVAAHGWHRASAKDRAARHPGPAPRTLQNFCAFHNLSET